MVMIMKTTITQKLIKITTVTIGSTITMTKIVATTMTKGQHKDDEDDKDDKEVANLPH